MPVYPGALVALVRDSGISSADFMILSCILLRKMDIVVVSGFDAMVGLGMPCWALAKDAKTETDTMPTGTTTRAMDRNI